MEAEIIQIEVKPRFEITIRHIMFQFLDSETAALGLIAYGNDGSRCFFYPVNVNPKLAPITFLHEAILCGPKDFKELMRKGYEEKADVIIYGKPVMWSEYEMLFSGCEYYSLPSDDGQKVLDVIQKEEHEKIKTPFG